MARVAAVALVRYKGGLSCERLPDPPISGMGGLFLRFRLCGSSGKPMVVAWPNLPRQISKGRVRNTQPPPVQGVGFCVCWFVLGAMTKPTRSGLFVGLCDMLALVIATLWGGHPCSCLGKEAPIRGGLGSGGLRFGGTVSARCFGFIMKPAPNYNRQWWTMMGSWPFGEGAGRVPCGGPIPSLCGEGPLNSRA